ncbi:MAG: hypothetical protein ACYCPQ_06720 [Elusimicrobiota bacterium]
MAKRFLPCALALSWLCAYAAPVWAGQKLLGSVEDIPRNLIASAGTPASNGTVLFDGDAGEAAVSTSAGGGYVFESGLMNIFAQPGSLIALSTAALSTSTGTLTLAWTAPGLNGSVQSGNGYYRIDYSSDPAQAALFDPTATNPAYVVQFATVTSPGQAQVYALQNLLPNTTYYAKIYLGDQTKFFAETSPQAADSTLANQPVSPVLTDVAFTSVTFSWSFPAGGAEGYDLEGSSIAFGAVPFASSVTANGGTLTLTVNGLTPGGTYYFRLSSLNWQGLANYETLIATATLPVTIEPVTLVSISSSPIQRDITLTWKWFSPTPPNQTGVMIVISSMPITSVPTNGVAYSPGYAFPDKSVVASTAAGTLGGVLLSTPTYTEAGLTLDVTAYVSLFSENTLDSYSAAVSTLAVLDLPPLAPAGLAASIVPRASSMTISWAGVESNTDGSLFHNPIVPVGWEMSEYDVYQATGIIRANWVLVSTLPANAASVQAPMAPPGQIYYYKVVSRDSFPGQTTDAAMVVDTLGNLYAIDSDNVTRLEIPAAMAGLVQKSGNTSGEPLLVRASDRPQDMTASPYIFKSVDFEPYEAPSNQEQSSLALPQNAVFDVALGYQVQNGAIVASGAGNSLALSAANPSVGLFWYNGNQNVKMYGTIDTINDQLLGQTATLGNYRLQSFVTPSQASFDPGSNMSTRVITPTVTNCAGQHGCDDHVEIWFPNPEILGYSGTLYDARGLKVADMAQTGCDYGGGPGTPQVCLVWNGRGSNGQIVARGVYLYEIKVGGQTWTGTIVVIR